MRIKYAIHDLHAYPEPSSQVGLTNVIELAQAGATWVADPASWL